MPRYVVRHHGGFKYVRAIPKDLQPLEGKKVWTEYIGRDANEASTRALELAAEHNRRAKVLRSLPDTDKRLITAKGGFSRCEADAYFADHLAATLFPLTLNKRRGETAKRTIASLMVAHAPIHNVAARLEGKPISRPRLFDLIDLHIRNKPRLSPKVREREQIYLRRFAHAMGDLAAPDVTRQHVLAFRDHLEAKGYKSPNITQHLAKLNALFNIALSEGVVAANPAYGIKARMQATEKFADDESSPFTSAHVRRIFKAMGKESPDFRWIVKLLAYHGARSGEICQLKCADVTTLHGIPVLRIHDRHGSIKNRFSMRDVPIHPKCKDIVAYAGKVSKAHGPDSWLFPSLKDSKAGRAHAFQNYGNRFLRQIGITDRQPGARQYDHTMHSFRHLFSTLCREVEMPDAMKNALKGHALGKGEGGKYGEGPSLKVRARWIAKVDPLKG